MSPCSRKPPQIAIIGAGVAGLTFAAVLAHNASFLSSPPHFTIYERDSARVSRDQGGSLDLHTPTGQRAIHAAGLTAAFDRVARHEGEAIRLLDKTGRVWLEQSEAIQDGKGTRPEIDRGTLKDLLLSGLPDDTVEWGCTVVRVEAVGDGTGKHKLVLEDGREEVVDLVVGADGAWSKTRPLIMDDKPHYSGIHVIEVRLSGVDDRLPAIAKLVGPGTMFAFSDNKAVIGQRNSGSNVRAYFVLRVPVTWHNECGIDWSSVSTARPGLRAQFADWSPDLISFIDECDEGGLWLRPMYQLSPAEFAWHHKPGVTLVGDAAHLMTFFGGLGANVAMLDGAELAEAIVDAAKSMEANPGIASDQGWMDEAVRTYEKTMFPRARETMEETLGNMEASMSADAPASRLKRIEEGMKAAAGTAELSGLRSKSSVGR